MKETNRWQTEAGKKYRWKFLLWWYFVCTGNIITNLPDKPLISSQHVNAQRHKNLHLWHQQQHQRGTNPPLLEHQSFNTVFYRLLHLKQTREGAHGAAAAGRRLQQFARETPVSREWRLSSGFAGTSRSSWKSQREGNPADGRLMRWRPQQRQFKVEELRLFSLHTHRRWGCVEKSSIIRNYKCNTVKMLLCVKAKVTSRQSFSRLRFY